MKSLWRRLGPALFGVAVIALVLGGRWTCPDPFARLRLVTFDTLQRLQPWDPKGNRVQVVDIDDESLKRYGQWPWPRALVATLVRRLQDEGASVIAFDVVFAEHDRTSPAFLAATWARSFGWTNPENSGVPLPDYDRDLAAAYARGRVVAGFGLTSQANDAVPRVDVGIATIGGNPADTVSRFHGAVPNLGDLEAAAAGNGSFSMTGERDQIIRRLPLLVALDSRLLPSLALEALRVAQGEDSIGVRADRSGGAVVGYTVRVGDYDIPVAVDGTIELHHSAPLTRRTLPAWRVLEAEPDATLAADVKGRVILVGTSAVGLSDLRATPLNPLEPGVNLHARLIEQIMARRYLSRPLAATGFEFVTAGLLSLLLVALATLFSLRMAILAGAFMAGCALVGSLVAFLTKGLLLDPSLVLVTLIASGVTTGLARYFVAERSASRLRSAFTHYLSADLVEALARDPDRLKLGGEMREMTFLFTDLQGFTSLMESADPETTVTLLNDYLDGLCRIAVDHGGTVDKIVGDALHVMFNAPLDQPDHPERGVRCAIAIDAFAQAYAATQRARGIAFGETRIGVNTGPALVGNFGGSRRFDYTAHGDAINTAARLESANKALGTRICVARSTAEDVRGIVFLPVGTLMLKGKSRGVEVFAPEITAAAWTPAYLATFARMAEGDEAAWSALVALYERHPDEPVLALHAGRINAGQRSIRMAA